MLRQNNIVRKLNIPGNVKMWVLNTILRIKMELPALVKGFFMYFYPIVA